MASALTTFVFASAANLSATTISEGRMKDTPYCAMMWIEKREFEHYKLISGLVTSALSEGEREK